MPPILNGKAALVTGGSRGIGAAIARVLASNGAAVAISYSNSRTQADALVKEIERQGGRAVAILADSADAQAVKASVQETIQKLGSLNILVNNAGIAAMAPLEQFKLEDFDRMLAINVRAVWIASQEAARHMKDGDRIITIGSCNADRMPFPGGGPYAMTKAAVVGLIAAGRRAISVRRGITVNVIQPGPVDTDMNPCIGTLCGKTQEPDGAAAVWAGRKKLPKWCCSISLGRQRVLSRGRLLTIDGGFDA